MFRSFDHHQGLLLCMCKLFLLNGVLAYFDVWPYVICALFMWCTVPVGDLLLTTHLSSVHSLFLNK
jgi:hypothetical protein